VTRAKELVHIHIPKSGGSFINHFLNTQFPKRLAFHDHATMSNVLSSTWPAWLVGLGPVGGGGAFFAMEYEGRTDAYLKMSYQLAAPEYPGRYKEAIKFSICRNPFDWLVSYYMSGAHGFDNIAAIHGIKSFPEFVEKFCDRDFRWYHHGLHQFLYYQLLDKDGFIEVKWILKMEDIKEAVNIMLLSEGLANEEMLEDAWTKYGADHRSVSHQARHGNASLRREHKDHRMYYTDALREMAEEKFKIELSMLHYDFDGRKENDAPAMLNDGEGVPPGIDIYFEGRSNVTSYGTIISVEEKG
jgi:hypothetical protein|tara:strand:+ start:260 stop:1159 length:900 start_codon:yes stop_codon:yes gene_type:complete